MKKFRMVAALWLATLLGTLSLSGQEPAPLTWVSGDTHLHTHGCGGATTPAALVRLMVAADLQVGCSLVWGSGYNQDLPFFTGEDHPASRPGHILHYDLEVSAFPAAELGHLNILGLSEVEFSDRPFETPRSGLPVVKWALQQGPRVLVGMNHGFAWPGDGSFPSPGRCCIPFEFPVHVANGTLSFFEEEFAENASEPITRGTMLLWRVVQNSGFRVALTGASDYLCIIRGNLRSPNALRTYVLIEGELSYEAFLEGIRAGRTLLAVGAADWMDLTVEGVPLGGEIETSAGEELHVVVESDLSRRDRVTVLVNGEPVETLTVDAGPQTHTLTLTLEKSSWIAARTARVQTSAIYALVDGQPIRASADDACYLVRYMDHLSNLVLTGALSLDAAEALPTYQRARDLFEQRFFEAGGTTCGNVPVARFTLSSQMGEAPLEVCVDAAGSTTPEGTEIVSYEWDFGQGGTAMGVDACHTYTLAGRYDITLTVRNDARRRGGMKQRVSISCPSDDVTPWTSVDIGAPSIPGAARLDGEGEERCLSICASGRILSGTEDSFHFVHREFSGDTVLSARVMNLEGADNGAQVGVMLRESLDRDAPYAAMTFRRTRTSGTFRFLYRDTKGSRTRSRRGGPRGVQTPDVRVKIERRGEEFIGYASSDGIAWEEVSRQAISGFPATFYGGIVAIGAEPRTGPFEALSAQICNLEVDARQPRLIRSDANADGTIDISDVTVTLEALFVSEREIPCNDAADSNDDGAVNIADSIFTLGYLFLGGAEVPDPGPDSCGVDPTNDELNCDSFPSCE